MANATIEHRTWKLHKIHDKQSKVNMCFLFWKEKTKLIPVGVALLLFTTEKLWLSISG